MSAEESMTDRDEQVMELLNDGEAAPPSQTDDPDELRETIHELAGELESTKEDLRQYKTETNRRLNAIEQQLDGDVSTAGSTTLEQYASMPEDVREETLGPTDNRAVTLYLEWDNIAWKGPYDDAEWCVDTKAKANQKNNPSRLKVNLERATNESLDWKEVYRAMKAVAKLSGGDEETDQYGRTHIVGGDFEYHQLPTADNSGAKRVLKEVANDG
jgi:hypothetical protein